MTLLRGLSIRQKLIRVMMVTSVSSVGLTCLAFVAYEVRAFRAHIEHELISVAQVIGANTRAALSFDDGRAASETLAALRAEPRIVAARLFDAEGKAFADYRAEHTTTSLPATVADVHEQRDSRLVVLRPIRIHEDLIGHLYIEADARDSGLRVAQYLAIALVVLVAGSLLALVLSAFLEGVISRPLVALARTAGEIADRRDYSLRATKESEDETGQLIDRFNEMLSQIQARDLALRDAHRVLETRVDERTRALKVKIDEQRRTEEALVVARDAAEAASRAKSAFLATMSHELRTPLNAIIGYGEMLSEEAVDNGEIGRVDDLDKITSAGKHLLALINDVLDLSKIEAGRMELMSEPFGLPRLVHEVAAAVRPLVEMNRNTLIVEVPADLPTVRGDAMRVRQVLLNLLSNATKFTEAGTVHLRARATETAIMVEVRDTGIGMTPDEVSRLFREFSQADASTSRKFGGSGLGLAISQRLCRLMGGEIAVQSAVGRGSIFTVTLPAGQPLPTLDVSGVPEVLNV